MGEAQRTGVVLADGISGSGLLHGLLAGAARAFPEVFGPLSVPEPAPGTRLRFAELLPQLELLRTRHAARTEVARWLCRESLARVAFVDGEGERPLSDVLAEPASPLPMLQVALPSTRGYTPRAEFGGRTYIADQLEALAGELARRHVATHAATQALGALAERAQLGGISLAGERFVLLGAGAELSPVYALLEAGAEVLWIDLKRPPVDHLLEPWLGGTLHYVADGADLLSQPAAVRATIVAFAADRPLRIGMYAFANGQSRALRLALTMNALVRSLPAHSVKSLHFLLSSTSVSPIAPEDARCADARLKRSGWRGRIKSLPLSPGHVGEGAARVSSGVVSAQGASYQLAEYVGKRLAAEAFLAYGSALGDDPARAPLGVTAPMLPVTATRSLDNPVLAAAILGAPSYDMLIAAPATSAAIGACLLIHDLLEEPPPGDLQTWQAQLFSRQFHGGVHAQPFALDGLMRVAALRGMAQRPKLALELLR